MNYKDPSQQLLKAYQNILQGQIVYGSEQITIGTRIPRKKNKYVLIYIESAIPNNTGDSIIYNIMMGMQIVSMQAISEGDETVINSILDQVLNIVGNEEAILMADFNCLNSQFADMDPIEPEMTEANYTITKKLRMQHFIEQK